MSHLHPLSPRRAVLCAVALLTTLAAAAPAEAASTTLTATLSQSSVTAGTTVTLTGKVKPAGKRTIRLEVRTGKTWTKRASTTSSAKGAFSVSVPTSTAGTFVLRADAPKKGRIKAVLSASVTLTVSAPVLPPCCKVTVPSPTPTPAPSPTPTPAATPTPGPPAITTPASVNSSFRAIYVLAADQTASAGEIPAIRADIDALDGWFATQTNGSVQPRWVRDASGTVPVTTITLPRAASAYATATFASVVAEIQAAAPVPSNQKTVAWFDVGSPDGCGVTGSGTSVVFEAACDIHPATSDTWPYGATYLAAHEMTHNFGAVNACAPHQGNGGHVTDDPRDVLYSGPQARDWDHLMLDPGHDDYYDTGSATCPGIESSPFWTATSDPLS